MRKTRHGRENWSSQTHLTAWSLAQIQCRTRYRGPGHTQRDHGHCDPWPPRLARGGAWDVFGAVLYSDIGSPGQRWQKASSTARITAEAGCSFTSW